MAGATSRREPASLHAPTFSKHLFFQADSDRARSVGASFCRMRAYQDLWLFHSSSISETVRETFQAWNAERESLDSELSESLAALEEQDQPNQ